MSEKEEPRHKPVYVVHPHWLKMYEALGYTYEPYEPPKELEGVDMHSLPIKGLQYPIEPDPE